MRPSVCVSSVGLGVFAALHACSLTTSLDGYTGGVVAASSDAGADAPTGTASMEASMEGGTAPACPPDAAFCDLFERELAESKWDDLVQENGSAITISTERFTSATRSMRLQVTRGVDHGSAYFTKVFADVGTGVRVDFDIYLDTINDDGLGTFGQITPIGGTHPMDHTLRVEGGTTKFLSDADGTSNAREYVLARSLRAKTWEHVSIALRVDLSKVTIRFGDDIVLNDADTLPLTPGGVQVVAGSAFIGPSAKTSLTEPWVVYLDNYAVTRLP